MISIMNTSELTIAGYLFDAIEFSDEQKASSFRKNAISRGWNGAVNMYRSDTAVLFSQTNIFRLDHQVESGILYRLFHFLNEDENFFSAQYGAG